MAALMGDEQARRRVAEKWKEKDKATRDLLLCAVSTIVKLECCASAAHTLDEVDLIGYSMYRVLSGLDCTIQGFVLHHLIDISIQLYVRLHEAVYVLSPPWLLVYTVT